MNGKPIGGSPFPVFFSPPEVAAPPEAQAADLTAGALTSTGLPNSLAETAQQIALRLQPDLAKLTTASIKAANMLPAASSMVSSTLRLCRAMPGFLCGVLKVVHMLHGHPEYWDPH